MKARIIIGSNYGDEGKGTIVAKYANVLNVLTNGGAQRGHSILTDLGSTTFQHFGSGTYHGADSYYSRFFILNPIQFVEEYKALLVKPKHIYRDPSCRWSTPYDSIANLITEELKKRTASCGMGIWNTILRYTKMQTVTLDEFLQDPITYLTKVRRYYETLIGIPTKWKDIWNSNILVLHFISDCKFMVEHTEVCSLASLNYSELIFENGQGLLLCDTGKDTFDTTPSNTGILYSLELLKDIPVEDITAHYVTRPYLTRHGDGLLMNQTTRQQLSSGVYEDRTNFNNPFQGEFRFGYLDIDSLKKRIEKDARGYKYVVEVTHCDEMDREVEFKKVFKDVNFTDSPLVPLG